MLAPDFDELNFKLGKQYLEPKGFKYENGNWHFLNTDYQLSFILGKDKNASHFQVKYLTVALRHRDVPMGDNKVKLVPYADIDKAAPIQISPLKLANYVASRFSPSQWKYENVFKTPRHENSYVPIYYGGLDKWVLKDRSLTAEQNKSTLKKALRVFHVELVSEDEAKELLRDSMIQVAEYAKDWADYMTPDEIVSQLKEYGEGWWILNQWIDAYCETFAIPS